jgi:hypothetical protein
MNRFGFKILKSWNPSKNQPNSLNPQIIYAHRAVQDTIYEIYKRNIAQIVIKNVRKRTKESKQKKQKQK